MFSVSNIIFATTFCNRACVGFLAFIRNYESPLYAHITLVSNTLVSNTRLRKQASVRIACDDWIIIFFVGVCFWWTFAWRQMSWRGVTNLMISIIVCVHRFPFSIQSLGCTQTDRCDPKIFVVCQRYYAAKSASDVSDQGSPPRRNRRNLVSTGAAVWAGVSTKRQSRRQVVHRGFIVF